MLKRRLFRHYTGSLQEDQAGPSTLPTTSCREFRRRPGGPDPHRCHNQRLFRRPMPFQNSIVWPNSPSPICPMCAGNLLVGDIGFPDPRVDTFAPRFSRQSPINAVRKGCGPFQELRLLLVPVGGVRKVCRSSSVGMDRRTASPTDWTSRTGNSRVAARSRPRAAPICSAADLFSLIWSAAIIHVEVSINRAATSPIACPSAAITVRPRRFHQKPASSNRLSEQLTT